MREEQCALWFVPLSILGKIFIVAMFGRLELRCTNRTGARACSEPTVQAVRSYCTNQKYRSSYQGFSSPLLPLIRGSVTGLSSTPQSALFLSHCGQRYSTFKTSMKMLRIPQSGTYSLAAYPPCSRSTYPSLVHHSCNGLFF